MTTPTAEAAQPRARPGSASSTRSHPVTSTGPLGVAAQPRPQARARPSSAGTVRPQPLSHKSLQELREWKAAYSARLDPPPPQPPQQPQANDTSNNGNSSGSGSGSGSGNAISGDEDHEITAAELVHLPPEVEYVVTNLDLKEPHLLYRLLFFAALQVSE